MAIPGLNLEWEIEKGHYIRGVLLFKVSRAGCDYQVMARQFAELVQIGDELLQNGISSLDTFAAVAIR